MEYILNETPVRTSKNYGINNIKINLELPQYKKFDNLSFETEELEKIEVEMEFNKNEKLNNKLGLELNGFEKITINVPDFIELKTPVIIDCLFDEDNQYLVDNIKIVMGKNSKANFILHYNSDEDYKYFHTLKQETILNENSEANIIIANLISNESKSFIAIQNEVKENAKLTHTIVDFGGETKISNYYTKLIGYNSSNFVNNIYLGNKNDLIDINYNIDALGKHTKCNIESQGAIAGNTKKNFKGTIDFKKGCTKSIGTENENCMILSNKAKSKSLPMLLCHEDDVFGEHGVSSGKPDESKLFYIMTKGISYNEARKLLVKANFNNVINGIESNILKEKINKKIEEQIEQI